VEVGYNVAAVMADNKEIRMVAMSLLYMCAWVRPFVCVAGVWDKINRDEEKWMGSKSSGAAA
jgi:hypothetical protein